MKHDARRPIGQPGAMADKPLTGIALAAVAGGAVVTLIVGTVLAVASGSPFWLVAAVATMALNLGMIRIGRRRMTREHVATPTGRVLVAVTAQQGPTRWVGGANVPGSMGRMNATWPLAVLQLGGTEVTLDVRPPLLGRLFGVEHFASDSAHLAEVFPVKGRFFGTTGVALRRDGEAIVYFWTTKRESILQALAATGFPVSWDERRAYPY